MRLVRLLAAVLIAITLSGCSLLRFSQAAPTQGADAQACAPNVDRGVLPDWARAGFSEAQPAIAHTIGRDGNIAAILFGDPLTAPPIPGKNNKILWVARRFDGVSDLSVVAQRMNGSAYVDAPVERTVQGGPGPSTIDVPEAGCWRFELEWGSLRDSLDLEYIRPPVATP